MQNTTVPESDAAACLRSAKTSERLFRRCQHGFRIKGIQCNCTNVRAKTILGTKIVISVKRSIATLAPTSVACDIGLPTYEPIIATITTTYRLQRACLHQSQSSQTFAKQMRSAVANIHMTSFHRSLPSASNERECEKSWSTIAHISTILIFVCWY